MARRNPRYITEYDIKVLVAVHPVLQAKQICQIETLFCRSDFH